MIIKNASLVDYRGTRQEDICIRQGKIHSIGHKLVTEKGEEVLDAQGLVLMPSFVDLHVHFREPGYEYKEDIESGSRAAVKGGYTFCNAMANTNPVVDNNKIHQQIISKADDIGLIDLYQVMTVTKGMEGKDLIDFENLPPRARFLSDDGKGILSNDIMYKACIEAKNHGVGIMVHAEDPDISPYDYRVAEDIITIRDIYLAKASGARIHFSHVSTYDSLEAIRIAKEAGIAISCEVTPHHIALANLDYRVNPPIRKDYDRKKVIESIIDGTIDAIATDHAPHSKEDKLKGAPGSIGLETAFSVCFTELVETGLIGLEDLSKLMSYNPSKILGINHGLIEIGSRADLVLVDIDQTSKINEAYLESKSKNSIFMEQEYKGRVMMTLRKGVIVYEDNRQALSRS